MRVVSLESFYRCVPTTDVREPPILISYKVYSYYSTLDKVNYMLNFRPHPVCHPHKCAPSHRLKCADLVLG